MSIEDSLNNAVTKVWGTNVVYTRASDDEETEIKGVFDNAWIEVLNKSTLRPTLKIRLGDLEQTPVKDDSVEINSTTYKVMEIRPDGVGNATLILKKSS